MKTNNKKIIFLDKEKAFEWDGMRYSVDVFYKDNENNLSVACSKCIFQKHNGGLCVKYATGVACSNVMVRMGVENRPEGYAGYVKECISIEEYNRLLLMLEKEKRDKEIEKLGLTSEQIQINEEIIKILL